MQTLFKLSALASVASLAFATHSSDIAMFRVGESASQLLKKMAEGGAIGGLASVLGNAGAAFVENPAGDFLNPGVSTSFTLDSEDYGYLSLGAMLLPTNDGFVGLDSWKIPDQEGSYTVALYGYDAGTEANDELAGSMPTPGFITFGSGGSGVETVISNDKVHIHLGNLGDSDASGGKSDLSSSDHRWLNPVAIMTVIVK